MLPPLPGTRRRAHTAQADTAVPSDLGSSEGWEGSLLSPSAKDSVNPPSLIGGIGGLNTCSRILGALGSAAAWCNSGRERRAVRGSANRGEAPGSACRPPESFSSSRSAYTLRPTSSGAYSVSGSPMRRRVSCTVRRTISGVALSTPSEPLLFPGRQSAGRLPR
jgi:hypothetical protein